jgi:hypothetical protein
MTNNRAALVTSAVIMAAIAAIAFGVARYSALATIRNRAIAPLPGQTSNVPEASPTGGEAQLAPLASGAHAPDEPEQAARMTDNRVENLIHDADQAVKEYWKTAAMAKTSEQHRALGKQHRTRLSSYAEALMKQAEISPATPAARDALIWVVKNLPDGSTLERAKELLARDHIQSSAMEPLFTWRLSFGAPSKATERLLRGALAENPDRKLQGLACYYLARYLDFQASSIRGDSLYDPVELERERPRRSKARESQLDPGRRDPLVLEHEGAALYERVVNEFGDIPCPEPSLDQPIDPSRGVRSTTLDELAAIYRKALTIFGIGRPAPEIEGLDLDGKPMKLSEYRGKVVVIYFGGPVPPSDDKADRAAVVTDAIQKVAERHEKDRFALLGVSTINPGRSAGRGTYQAGLKLRGLNARFWWDLDQSGGPGPIQTAWNVRGQTDLYILDHQGVIRYKNNFPPKLLENAVSTLLREMADETARLNKSH